MKDAKLTSKWQITVPRDVRERLKLRPGDRLRFREKDNGTVVVEAVNVDVMSLRGSIKPRVRGVTVERMREVARRRGAGLK